MWGFLTIAYIDPGTGSMIVQSIIAGVLAVLFFFRAKIRWLLGKLRGGRAEDKTDAGT